MLGPGAGEDRAATAHILTGALFLTIGGLLFLASLLSIRFPSLIPLSFGILDDIASLALWVGFLTTTLVGGAYYVVPRITGARLGDARIAMSSLVLAVAVVVVGAVVVALGGGDGRSPFGLPWWLDLPLLIALTLPFFVIWPAVSTRREKLSYVSLWFVIGAVAWLPLLVATGSIPGSSALLTTLADLFFAAGFVTMFALALGSGLFYYVVVKDLDTPLASRQLARIGFWSYAVAAAWWGVAQLAFGPGPTWLYAIAPVLGLAFPVAALANAANVAATLEGSWTRVASSPAVMAGVVGCFFAVVVGAMAAMAGFATPGAVVALTPFWDAVETGAILGAATLLAAAIAFHSLPRMVGRELTTVTTARRFIRLTLIGVGAIVISLAAAGLILGFSWIGGSNTGAFVDVGDSWGEASGSATVFLLLAISAGMVALWGQLAYTSTIWATVTSGKAGVQEVLVSVETADE